MDMAHATFGAGCFWGIEAAFAQLPGVTATSVGYSGGHVPDPDYRQVCTGRSGHAEVVRVTFDPERVSYAALLDRFWEIHDPTTLNRQGPDVGTQYRSAIFCHGADQETAARASLAHQQASGRYADPIVTEIQPADTFYPAEDYHQQYLAKRGLSHCH